MLNRAFAGVALCLALLFVGLPAFTLSTQVATAQACKWNYDKEFVNLMSAVEGGAPIVLVEIGADRLDAFVAELGKATGVTYEGVTRAFMAVLVDAQGNVAAAIVGLEVGGCLIDAIEIEVPINVSMSGRLPDGRTAA
jgi:hypothetical protein